MPLVATYDDTCRARFLAAFLNSDPAPVL